MGFASKLAVVMVCAVTGLGVVGCDKDRDEMRPDMDKVQGNEQGMQSRDLREMTDRMAPDLLQIPEIVQNPNRVVVVMKPIQNKLVSNPGEDLTIYVARLKTLLNSSKTRDRMAFVEDAQTLARLQGEELGNPDPFEDAARTGQPTNTRVTPQFALKGIFYEKYEGKTSYYLCTFQLTDLKTGIQVWENSYEVKTLNKF